MGMFTWTSLALVSLYALFTCDVSATSTQLMSNPTQDDINLCDLVYCGKGTCQLSSTELIGFTCDCESGWKKPNVGPFELPPCVIPNCTVDLNCGNGSPPPPSPSSAQPTKVTDPCLLNVCGDGTCESHGFDFRCQCNEGSANLLNDPKMFCFKKCSLGGDCNGFDLGFGSPSTEIPPPPPPGTSGTGTAGETLCCTRELRMLAMTIIALIFQIWI